MIILAGNNAALLEGLAQALSHTGHRVAATGSLEDAEELLASGPLVTVLDGSLLTGADSAYPFVARTLAAGSALVTFRESSDAPRPLAPGIGRHVLADLILPLERNRLVALAEHLAARARVTGRVPDLTPQEPPAS